MVQEALELCEQQPEGVHLALIDVVMPGINGHELVERMRDHVRDVLDGAAGTGR